MVVAVEFLMALQTAGDNASSVFVVALAKRLPDPDADGTLYWGHLGNEASTPALSMHTLVPTRQRCMALGLGCPQDTPAATACALQLLPATN